MSVGRVDPREDPDHDRRDTEVRGRAVTGVARGDPHRGEPAVHLRRRGRSRPATRTTSRPRRPTPPSARHRTQAAPAAAPARRARRPPPRPTTVRPGSSSRSGWGSWPRRSSPRSSSAASATPSATRRPTPARPRTRPTRSRTNANGGQQLPGGGQFPGNGGQLQRRQLPGGNGNGNGTRTVTARPPATPASSVSACRARDDGKGVEVTDVAERQPRGQGRPAVGRRDHRARRRRRHRRPTRVACGRPGQGRAATRSASPTPRDGTSSTVTCHAHQPGARRSPARPCPLDTARPVRGGQPSSSWVTRAAMADRSDRVRVTCANSGWPRSVSMTRDDAVVPTDAQVVALRDVVGEHDPAAASEPAQRGEQHGALEVLRLVDHDEAVGEAAAADVRERQHLEQAAVDDLVDHLAADHRFERVGDRRAPTATSSRPRNRAGSRGPGRRPRTAGGTRRRAGACAARGRLRGRPRARARSCRCPRCRRG